jgi:hypothetical protein
MLHAHTSFHEKLHAVTQGAEIGHPDVSAQLELMLQLTDVLCKISRGMDARSPNVITPDSFMWGLIIVIIIVSTGLHGPWPSSKTSSTLS